MNQLWSRCSQNKPMWSKCSHQPYGENIFRMSLGKFQMTANCYGGSNVAYMLILHSKYCINVPIGSRLNTWSGNIWNVPNLLLVGKWWVPSTRAYNVLKMFSLVSRPPRPQWLRYLSAIAKTEVSKIRHVEVLIFCGGSVPLLDASSTNLWAFRCSVLWHCSSVSNVCF